MTRSIGDVKRTSIIIHAYALGLRIFSERAAPPSFPLSRNVETFLFKYIFPTFPEIIVCCHTNTSELFLVRNDQSF